VQHALWFHWWVFHKYCTNHDELLCLCDVSCSTVML
jgi:hypothetical protein